MDQPWIVGAIGAVVGVVGYALAISTGGGWERPGKIAFSAGLAGALVNVVVLTALRWPAFAAADTLRLASTAGVGLTGVLAPANFLMMCLSQPSNPDAGRSFSSSRDQSFGGAFLFGLLLIGSWIGAVPRP